MTGGTRAARPHRRCREQRRWSALHRVRLGVPRFHRGVTDLNFLAGVFVAQAVHPVMSAQDSGGVVLNVTSISARRPSPGTAVYGAAKAALESLTRSLAVE
nr:SDR family NAD(P)-dependent oxidoreductase [Actinomadura rifamycini]